MQKLFTREWFSQGLIKETIFFLFMLPNMVAANSMLAHPGSPEEPYMGRTYITGMTRKHKMREGFVARTFHIPIGIDDELRMMAIKNCVRFSDMAIVAFKDFFRRQKGAS
jgi:hypothetical protein